MDAEVMYSLAAIQTASVSISIKILSNGFPISCTIEEDWINKTGTFCLNKKSFYCSTLFSSTYFHLLNTVLYIFYPNFFLLIFFFIKFLDFIPEFKFLQISLRGIQFVVEFMNCTHIYIILLVQNNNFLANYYEFIYLRPI